MNSKTNNHSSNGAANDRYNANAAFVGAANDLSHDGAA